VGAGAPAGDLMIRPGCATPGVTADFGAPSAWMTSGFGTPKAGPRATVNDCARTMRTWLRADQQHILSRAVETERLTVCALTAPDPAKGRPLAIVRVELELTAGHGIEATFSAWSGGPPTLIQPIPLMSPQPQPPQVKAVAAPFRTAYEDVALHLPGKPEACGDQKFYLDLQVPEVNHRLGPSDMYLTPPCEPDHPRELQGLGVAVPGSDPTADQCAAALERGPISHEFTPVAGSSFCSLSQATPRAPEPKLVALTVTNVDPATGAFDLSATAWTGTGVPK
jgi:hypothetical protein